MARPTKVVWVDETETTAGTVINNAQAQALQDYTDRYVEQHNHTGTGVGNPPSAIDGIKLSHSLSLTPESLQADDHSVGPNAYLTNARHDITARHTVGTVLPAGVLPVDVSTTPAAEGTSTSVARADHKHDIAAGTITDAEIASSAAIAKSKISTAGTFAKTDLPAQVAYKDEANVFTFDQEISKFNPRVNLRRSGAAQTPGINFIRAQDEGGSIYATFGIDGGTDEWIYFDFDGGISRVSWGRTTGKLTRGTVPLARMGTVKVDAVTTVAANITVLTLIQVPGDVHRFYIWSIRGQGAVEWFQGVRVTETEAVFATQHSVIRRGSSSFEDAILLINGNTLSLTAIYKIYELTEA